MENATFDPELFAVDEVEEDVDECASNSDKEIQVLCDQFTSDLLEA